ncbi:hypothetical protein HBB16_05550 [Pseudonocardia sp. MCCB 268]|nr:hypothetical protein [Pseudonocardia cytotoxica]
MARTGAGRDGRRGLARTEGPGVTRSAWCPGGGVRRRTVGVRRGRRGSGSGRRCRPGGVEPSRPGPAVGGGCASRSIRPGHSTDSLVLALHNTARTCRGDVHGTLRVFCATPDEDLPAHALLGAAPSGGDRCSSTATRSSTGWRATTLGCTGRFPREADVDSSAAGRNLPRGVPDTPLPRRWSSVHPRRTAGRPPATTPCRSRGSRSGTSNLARIEEYADLLATAFEAAPLSRWSAGDLAGPRD